MPSIMPRSSRNWEHIRTTWGTKKINVNTGYFLKRNISYLTYRRNGECCHLKIQNGQKIWNDWKRLLFLINCITFLWQLILISFKNIWIATLIIFQTKPIYQQSRVLLQGKNWIFGIIHCIWTNVWLCFMK